MNGAAVLLIGVTYKPDVSDQRETPARPLVRVLREMGADVRFHDPYVTGFEVDGVAVDQSGDLAEAVADADIVVVLQPHRVVLESGLLETARRVLDTSGRLVGPGIDRL